MSNTDKIEELLNDGEHHTTYAEAAPQIRALLDENRELRARLQQYCPHRTTVDTLPSFCAMCGKDL